jgi:hypothetical protein
MLQMRANACAVEDTRIVNPISSPATAELLRGVYAGCLRNLDPRDFREPGQVVATGNAVRLVTIEVAGHS